jgi:lincosamide nucleotidyltransferase A/C/D/E
MTATAVLEFLALMEASSISACLDGGWGVDALLGEQTREHGDLAVILNVDDLPRLAEATRSYSSKPGGTDTNFVLEMGPGNELDMHAIPFDEWGFGVFALPDGRKWPFPPAAFQGRGTIQGKAVRCLSRTRRCRVTARVTPRTRTTCGT